MRKLVEYARLMERKGLIHVENLARVSYLADIAFRVCFQKHKSKRKLKKYAVRPVKPKGKQGVDVEYNP